MTFWFLGRVVHQTISVKFGRKLSLGKDTTFIELVARSPPLLGDLGRRALPGFSNPFFLVLNGMTFEGQLKILSDKFCIQSGGGQNSSGDAPVVL